MILFMDNIAGYDTTLEKVDYNNANRTGLNERLCIGVTPRSNSAC
jgi:hypothetical protein